jgi:hypothetical protein
VSATIARLACAATLGATALVSATPARAEIGPVQLLSKTAAEQAQEASETALSADGHYLAFSGSIGGLRGIFRKDLRTGAVVPVMAESNFEEAGAPDKFSPSISADGRYVSFTTGIRLDEDDDSPASSDAYVADMSSSPPSYELASALDGCDPAQSTPHSPCGLVYSAGEGGSEASGRVALSADGRKVVFYTTAKSNLTSEPGGSTEGTPTPALQVVFRDLETDKTTLVSVERNPETGAMTDLPVAGGAIAAHRNLVNLRGAALSADGTTVAWLGAHVLRQVPVLSDEKGLIAHWDFDGSAETPYDEPLWRRMADGPQAPTRRIVGGGDPLAPGCPVGGTLADPTCQGPFPQLAATKSNVDAFSTGWLGPEWVNGVPQLSANGRIVALIGNPIGATNLYVVNMSDGLSRKQALQELTREVSVSPVDPTAEINTPANIPRNGHIFDLALSADGERIAFVTARQQFPLAPPSLVGLQPSSLGLTEVYLIDRDTQTFRWVTHGTGGASEASSTTGFELSEVQHGLGATAPSLDANGDLLAFTSDASNLVEGDGNDAKDAFLVDVAAASRTTGPADISPAPRKRRIKRPWRLALSAYSLPDGRVRLIAIVPSTGRLSAGAWGKLSPQARTRHLAAAAKRARKKTGGPVKLTLGLPRPLWPWAHSGDGVYAMARVAFHRGRKTLRGKLQVHFHAHSRQGNRGAR